MHRHRSKLIRVSLIGMGTLLMGAVSAFFGGIGVEHYKVLVLAAPGAEAKIEMPKDTNSPVTKLEPMDARPAVFNLTLPVSQPPQAFVPRVPVEPPIHLVGWAMDVDFQSGAPLSIHRLWHVRVQPGRRVDHAFVYSNAREPYELEIDGRMNDPNTFVGRTKLKKGPSGWARDDIRLDFVSDGIAKLQIWDPENKVRLVGELRRCDNVTKLTAVSKCAGPAALSNQAYRDEYNQKAFAQFESMNRF